MVTDGNQMFFIVRNITVPPGASAESMGSKAYGLLRLARLGLPVPPAFVLGTAVCRDYFAHGERGLPPNTRDMLKRGLVRLEESTGRRYADARRPMLVAVRSGAAVSMPGMMETILNVGLCEANLGGFLGTTGNPRLVRDCYRRLVRDFTTTVRGVEASRFDQLVERHCEREQLTDPSEIDSGTWWKICEESLELAHALTGSPFPEDPFEQLVQAVEAVIKSWNSEKAQHYRRLNGIDDAAGTAVTIQAMVFGNSGSTSGAGVGFTRNPATGHDEPYIDFRFNGQGEDVVSGRQRAPDGMEQLSRQLPLITSELARVCKVLEAEFRDMQDFEFTVEHGRLYLLQTRPGKRTPWAALRIAVDMVHEELISSSEAVSRLADLRLEQIERLHVGTDAGAPPLAKAVSASTGVASGSLVFDPKRAATKAAEGVHVILARPDIDTSDIEGIAACDGILTSRGGRTSHAAVVARQLNKVCLVGCADLQVDPGASGCIISGVHFSEGDQLTLDADSGRVYRGCLPLVHDVPTRELDQLAAWRAAAMTR